MLIIYKDQNVISVVAKNTSRLKIIVSCFQKSFRNPEYPTHHHLNYLIEKTDFPTLWRRRQRA